MEYYTKKYIDKIPLIMKYRNTMKAKLLTLLTEFYIEYYIAFRDNNFQEFKILREIEKNMTSTLNSKDTSYIIDEAKIDAREIVWPPMASVISSRHRELIERYKRALRELPKNMGINTTSNMILNKKWSRDLLRTLHPDKAPNAKKNLHQEYFKTISTLQNQLKNAGLITHIEPPPNIISKKQPNKSPNISANQQSRKKGSVTFSNTMGESLTEVYGYDNNGRLLALPPPAPIPIPAPIPVPKIVYPPIKKVNELFMPLYDLSKHVAEQDNIPSDTKAKAKYIKYMSDGLKNKPSLQYDIQLDSDRFIMIDFLRDLETISDPFVLEKRNIIYELLKNNPKFKNDSENLTTYGEQIRKQYIIPTLMPFYHGGRHLSRRMRYTRNKTHRKRRN